MIAVAAGTIGPIGFLGLQAGYAFEAIFGITNNFTLHTIIIIDVVLLLLLFLQPTGIHRGIQFLSRLNVNLSSFYVSPYYSLALGCLSLINFSVHLVPIYKTLLASKPIGAIQLGWVLETVFFIAWFAGYAPMMSIFVARISRGRTIRQIVLMIGVLAGIIMNFWFTTVVVRESSMS